MSKYYTCDILKHSDARIFVEADSSEQAWERVDEFKDDINDLLDKATKISKSIGMDILDEDLSTVGGMIIDKDRKPVNKKEDHGRYPFDDNGDHNVTLIFNYPAEKASIVSRMKWFNITMGEALARIADASKNWAMMSVYNTDAHIYENCLSFNLRKKENEVDG